jgi:hypothetical protein
MLRRDQAVRVVEAGPRLQFQNPGMVGKTAAEDEEKSVADEGAESSREESLPRDEDMLMGEEAAKDGGTFAFGDTAQENRDQPIVLDEVMNDLGH